MVLSSSRPFKFVLVRFVRLLGLSSVFRPWHQRGTERVAGSVIRAYNVAIVISVGRDTYGS